MFRTVVPFAFLPCLLSLAPLAAQAPCTVIQSDYDTPNFNNLVSMGGPNLLLAIQLTAPATDLVTRIEVFTGNGTGANTVAIWSDDPVNNQPQQMLGQGTWQMARVRGWQGANLTQPVLLTQGQVYWLVWGPQNGAQASVEGTSGGQPYRGSFDGGQSWNGPFQSNQWKLRVLGGTCGHTEVYGTACLGSGRTRPDLGWDGRPTIGASVDILLTGGVPSDFAVLAIGLSNTVFNAIPLPYDLAPHGAPGCLVQAAPAATSFVTTDGAGAATFTLALPLDGALIGMQFYDQWLVHDAGTNALGFKVSNAGSGIVGM